MPYLFIHGISLMQWETKGGLFGGILYGYPATEGQFNLPRIYQENIEMLQPVYVGELSEL